MKIVERLEAVQHLGAAGHLSPFDTDVVFHGQDEASERALMPFLAHTIQISGMVQRAPVIYVGEDVEPVIVRADAVEACGHDGLAGGVALFNGVACLGKRAILHEGMGG
jgi:hypothetical protein